MSGSSCFELVHNEDVSINNGVCVQCTITYTRWTVGLSVNVVYQSAVTSPQSPNKIVAKNYHINALGLPRNFNKS